MFQPNYELCLLGIFAKRSARFFGIKISINPFIKIFQTTTPSETALFIRLCKGYEFTISRTKLQRGNSYNYL